MKFHTNRIIIVFVIFEIVARNINDDTAVLMLLGLFIFLIYLDITYALKIFLKNKNNEKKGN